MFVGQPAGRRDKRSVSQWRCQQVNLLFFAVLARLRFCCCAPSPTLLLLQYISGQLPANEHVKFGPVVSVQYVSIGISAYLTVLPINKIWSQDIVDLVSPQRQTVFGLFPEISSLKLFQQHLSAFDIFRG